MLHVALTVPSTRAALLCAFTATALLVPAGPIEAQRVPTQSAKRGKGVSQSKQQAAARVPTRLRSSKRSGGSPARMRRSETPANRPPLIARSSLLLHAERAARFAKVAQPSLFPLPPRELEAIEALEARVRDLHLAGAGDEALRPHLLRLGALYERNRLLQEAAWTYAAAGPDQTRRAQRLEKRLEKILSGDVRRIHQLTLDGRRVRLAELEGGVLAVFRPAARTVRPDDSSYPDYHAYRVDRLLGANLVPVSARRDGPAAIGNRAGTLQYFFRRGATLKQLGLSGRDGQSDPIRFFRTLIKDYDGHNGNVFVLPLGKEAAIDTEMAFSFVTAMVIRNAPGADTRPLAGVSPAALRRALGKPLADRLLMHWDKVQRLNPDR